MSITTPVILPSVTVLSLSVVSSNAMHLTWAPVPGAAGYVVSRMNIDDPIRDTTYFQITDPSVTTFDDTGLQDGTDYNYRVTAVDARGYYSGQSARLRATTFILPPTDLIATVTSSGTAQLSWVDTTTQSGYNDIVEHSTDGINWQQVGSTLTIYDNQAPQPESIRIDGSFDSNATNFFRVRSVLPFWRGGFASAFVTATASIASAPRSSTFIQSPTGLTFDYSGYPFWMYWTDNATSSSFHDVVEGSLDGVSWQVVATTLPISGTSGPAPNNLDPYQVFFDNTTDYYLRVRSVDDATLAESAPATVNFTTPVIWDGTPHIAVEPPSAQPPDPGKTPSAPPSPPAEPPPSLTLPQTPPAETPPSPTIPPSLADSPDPEQRVAPPANLTASASSSQQINLTWLEFAPSPTIYNLVEGSLDGLNWQRIGTALPTADGTASFSLTRPFKTSHRYFFRDNTIDAALESASFFSAVSVTVGS